MFFFIPATNIELFIMVVIPKILFNNKKIRMNKLWRRYPNYAGSRQQPSIISAQQ